MKQTTLLALQAILEIDPPSQSDKVALIGLIEMAATPDRVLRFTEVAKRLGVCHRTVLRMARDGRLPVVKLPHAKLASGVMESELGRIFKGGK